MTNCGILRVYIDDSLARAFIRKSNFIVLIKTNRPRDISLARKRVKSLKNYIRFRGFKDFEVVVDLDARTTERIEFHVKGEVLYSLPIGRKSKFEGPC